MVPHMERVSIGSSEYERSVKNTFISYVLVTSPIPRCKSAPALCESNRQAGVSEKCPRASSTAETPFASQGNGARVSSEVTCQLNVFIGNLPCCVNAERLEEELCKMGFRGTYAKVSVPIRRNGSCLSYGFIKFHDEGDAQCFVYRFDGYRFPGIFAPKACTVAFSSKKSKR
eukprot:TRINITY_DN50274_c0_g1_i1.p1 TRINITY_DN50274_c0_g1~~TRINITY_DN50274_c0_g1_i1.p1  ORF type:complete len:172 (-),score=29.24 TRINITY_DN50274_c0_g1_i1:223-738(-)